jgi:imidazolonepropionase-like amidohydrolase
MKDPTCTNPARYVLRNVSIFDGTGRRPFLGTVVVARDRIQSVAPISELVETTGQDCVVEGRGRFLMPGMVEAHSHISWPSSIEQIQYRFRLPPAEMEAATWRNARILLDHGFTSAYSAGALSEAIEPKLRDEIRAGRTPGPRLIASTVERSPQGANGIETGGIDRGHGAESVRAFIELCLKNGIDSIKLLISGEDALLPGSSQNLLYSEEELEAICTAARDAGIAVAAHAQSAESIKLALKNGIKVLYHCTWADEEALDMLEAKRDEIFVAPAIGIIVATLEATPRPGFDMTAMKESAKPVVELAKALIPELRRRGVRVLPGGDYGFPQNPNGRNARDLEHFVTLFGYTPAEAISAATMDGGALMGMAGELGQIREGYLADLLLVDGDPLQDVRVLQNRDRINMVMQAGRIHRRPN